MTMPITDEEMKEVAAYAIKAAKDRYKKDLDFSEQSITILDNILTKIRWGFSGPADDREEGGLAYNHALIWGSYLGEYMISKWGGTWILKGTERIVSINNIEFSPIKFVFQKITDHPEYSVEDYLHETRKIIYTSVLNPQDAQFEPRKSESFMEQLALESTRKPFSINRRSVYVIAGILGALIIIAGIITGLRALRSGGIGAFGLRGHVTTTGTPMRALSTASPWPTDTPMPTVTPLSTYTPLPTDTPHPALSPSMTYTIIPSSTATERPTPLFPKNTLPPWLPPTSTLAPSTSTPKPPIVPPVVIESCEVNPSTVPPNINSRITFIVHFSAPGYGFTAENDSPYSGQSGCSGIDDNGDGIAYCDGSSGELPESTIVNVTITSSVGNCTARYQSP
jgi:hypothetical protein